MLHFTSKLLHHCNRVCSIDFKPEDDDILRFRSPTTDISEIDYIPEENDNVIFRFIDIGGQRKERLKVCSFVVGNCLKVLNVKCF